MGGEVDRVGGKFLEKLERKDRETRALGHFSRLTGGLAPEILLLSGILTKWPIHCDFHHPHQSLGYLKKTKVVGQGTGIQKRIDMLVG